MVTNEKTTYLGFIKEENGFSNFYPGFIITNEKMSDFTYNEADALFGREAIYQNINIGFPEKTATSITKKYKNELQNYNDKLCLIAFSKDDLIRIEKDGGYQIRLSFLDLIENSLIELLDENSFHWVTTTQSILDNDWHKKKGLIYVDEELTDGSSYYLEYNNKFVGPLTYRVMKGKSGLVVKEYSNYVISERCYFFTVGNAYNEKTLKFVLEKSLKPIATPTLPPPVTPPTTDNITEEKRRKLVDNIFSYRSYDKNMICNMLICITQGFLTVFSGEPGTGKTSICDKVAELLGVSSKSDNNNRYLSISVERGWTSKNDLIGYLNPLDGNIVDATGLYSALKTVDKEKREEGNYAPYLVLLDEANLSQMEYYWSNFIKLADDTAREKTPIYFGKDKDGKKLEFMIPDWFKFLATINNDQTTESLSPRLLDRAWVITLPTLDELGNDTSDGTNIERLSWKDLCEMFGELSVNEGLFDAAMLKLEKIYDIYKNGEKPVSPRSKIAIEKYIKSALACFEGNKDKDKDILRDAIDFVILQRLLPMLGGYISGKFKDELAETLKKYPLSCGRFEKMCRDENSANSSYVNFFM